MIELANGLDRSLQLLIIVQPAANLSNPFATHADLPGASTPIAHSQHEYVVSFAAGAFRIALAVPDGALQQRAARNSPVTGGLLTSFSRV
jgi:hypothetical protein